VHPKSSFGTRDHAGGIVPLALGIPGALATLAVAAGARRRRAARRSECS
jgi:hypothetical protein